MARKFLSSISLANGSVQSVSFSALAGPDLPADVVLTDATNTFTVAPQTIVSDADTHQGLIVKAHSATQSANLVEWRNSVNVAITAISQHGTVFSYDVTGSGTAAGFLGGLAAAGNIYNQFTVNGYLDSSGNWQRFNTSLYMTLNQLTGSPTTAFFTIYTAVPGANPISAFVLHFLVDGASGNVAIGNNLNLVSNTPQGPLEVQLTDSATNTIGTSLVVDHRTFGTAAAGFGVGVLFALDTDTQPVRSAAEIDTSWVTATDASRAGRLTIGAWDATAKRECVRLEANGTVALIGFFGATAVVQQANASQAGINAVTDANAKAALQAIYNLLKNYGLAPATA